MHCRMQAYVPAGLCLKLSELFRVTGLSNGRKMET